jgi:hypothetical protein
MHEYLQTLMKITSSNMNLDRKWRVSAGTRENEQGDRELRGDRAKCPERRDMLHGKRVDGRPYCN